MIVDKKNVRYPFTFYFFHLKVICTVTQILFFNFLNVLDYINPASVGCCNVDLNV